MNINVASGTGFGPTEMAAFDAALKVAGVANRNLVRLSSVIPQGAEVTVSDGPIVAPGEWGDRVYVVMAEQRTSHHGTEVWAGVGWVTFENGQGLFVENEGHSQSAVERNIRTSLMALMENREMKPDEGLIRMKIAGATCAEQPACAVAVAVYAAQGW